MVPAVGSIVCQVALLPSNNGLHSSGQYCLLGCVAPFEQWSLRQWTVLSVRLLCSLPILVICSVVSQVAVLSSYNSKVTACSNFTLICPNLSEFILNLFEFSRVFE